MYAIRATLVQSDLGFVEYLIALQHRESWQNVGPILASKAELASFCLEVSKQLGMRYVAPPVPVHLELETSKRALHEAISEMDFGKEDTPLSSPSTCSPAKLRPTRKSESDLDQSVKAVAAMFKKPKQGAKK